jgi:prepilin-type N-terminal cleavage/methylation domain-containing protein
MLSAMTVRDTTGTHSLRPTRGQGGFSLVELLLVITLLVIVVAALFPMHSQGIDTARATAMKSKGRGIWLAIMSANMEREAIKLGPLWPHEARLPIDQGGAGLFLFANATGYFKELMAGTDPEHQLVPDLSPEMLSASGYPSATNEHTLTAKNIAWRVAEVSDSFASTDAFLISKDIAHVTRSGASNAPVVLSRSGPIRGIRVVWVTRGGGLFDARKKHVTHWGMFFPSTNNVPFLPD